MGPLDLQTGTLRFERTPLEIGASLTRTAFLNSPVGAKAGIVVKNEPWCSWKFRVVDQGEPFLVVLYFLDEQLTTIRMHASHNRFWVDSDETARDRVNAQMAFHAKWLREICGVQECTHPWGSISSVFESKGYGADIVIQYGAGSTPGRIFTSIEETEARLPNPPTGHRPRLKIPLKHRLRFLLSDAASCIPWFFLVWATIVGLLFFWAMQSG